MYSKCGIKDQDYNNMILEGLKFIVIEAAVRYIQYAVCVFIKLHITTQSGPVILVILCHSH